MLGGICVLLRQLDRFEVAAVCFTNGYSDCGTDYPLIVWVIRLKIGIIRIAADLSSTVCGVCQLHVPGVVPSGFASAISPSV